MKKDTLTIVRVANSETGTMKVEIEIRDNKRQKIYRGCISLKNFANCIMGVTEIPIERLFLRGDTE